MNTYLIALFVHVAAVLGLFSAIAITATCLASAQRARETAVVRSWAAVAAAVDKAIPGITLVLLGSAVYMVRESWTWDTGWVVVSLVQFGVASVLGPAVNARRFKAIHGLAEASPDGPVSPELSRKLNDVVLGTTVRTMTAASVGVAYLMVMKPSVGASVLALAVFTIAGLATSLPSMLGGRVRPSAGQARFPQADFRGAGALEPSRKA